MQQRIEPRGVEQAIQVHTLDSVEVYESDSPHACSGERLPDDCTHATCADDTDVHAREMRAFGADREAVRLALEAEDIEARALWKPMHLQPIYASHPAFGGEVSAHVFDRGLCLPSGTALTEEQQDRVVATMLALRTTTVPG